MMYSSYVQNISMHSNQSINKMATNVFQLKLTIRDEFFNVNTGNAIKLF